MRIVEIVCECYGASATAEVGPSAMFLEKMLKNSTNVMCTVSTQMRFILFPSNMTLLVDE